MINSLYLFVPVKCVSYRLNLFAALSTTKIHPTTHSLMAKDPSVFKIKGLSKAFHAGDFSLEVAGSPREDLNGLYVQQKKYFGRRPVFLKAGALEIFGMTVVFYNFAGSMAIVDPYE